jgi:hypothetical protein
MYEFIQNAIRIFPIITILVVFIFAIRFNWYFRLIYVVLMGWIILIVVVHLYWWHAFEFAPTLDIQNEIASKDTGPISVIYIIGWVYSLVMYWLLELIVFLGKFSTRLLKNRYSRW